MFYKPSLVSLILVAYLASSSCLISPSLMAKDFFVSNSSMPPTSSLQATSNLTTNNPFVPQSNGSLNKAKNPPGPQSITNKSQVLQKYLQFKSIAIINKKKYFSIFNKRTNKAFWISEGETVENFRVTNYSPKSNSISITDGINTEIITIITANETPLSVVSTPSQVGQEVSTPPIPEATAKQNQEKGKTPPRRRVIPAKR